MSDIGHNSISGAAAEALRSIIERVERLHEERKALADDIADILREAKATGWDVKTIRALIAERRKEPAAREEAEQLLDLYRRAVDGTNSASRAGAEGRS